MFLSMVRASFAKAFEYARYCNRIKDNKADEGAYFLASALRGTCEELIALKFIHQLPVKERDEVIAIEMNRGVSKAVEEQAKFFDIVRPFQPVIKGGTDAAAITRQKTRIDNIAKASGLWTPQKGKLPSVEQMADKVAMRSIYDYFYRISSDVVHFNPRIALRSGWGDDPRKGTFSTKNFCRYYLFYSQIYSVFLFIQLCRAFQQDLALSRSFLKTLDTLDRELGDILRWPEAITFEELNKEEPSWWLRAALKFAHEQGWDKETTAANLKWMGPIATPSTTDEPSS